MVIKIFNEVTRKVNMNCTTQLGYILTFISILIICEINSYVLPLKLKECSAWNNEKWNDNKNKCVPCRACPAGRARNFSSEVEVETGPNGDLQCLPCEKCPNGHYVRIPEAKGIPVMCVLCSAECASMNRYMTKACSSQSNWQCGDCLPGFENTISDDFPCQKILTNTKASVVTTFSTSRRIPEYEHVTHKKDTKESTKSLPYIADDVNDNAGQNKSGTRSHSLSGIVVAAIAVPIVAAVLIVAALVIGCLHTQSCHKTNSSTEKLSVSRVESSSTEKSSTTYSSLSDSDIEVDCRGDSDLTRPPNRCRLPKNIESTEEQLQLVRGEISNATSLPIGHLHRVSEDLQFLERMTTGRPQMVCHCPSLTAGDCRESCAPLMDQPSRSIGENIDLIRLIANSVCHNPLKLFRYIGAKDSDVYNLNDDRDRNLVSQKEFIYNVLKRWLQVNNEAESIELFQGLCHGGFHRINKAIHEQYSDLFPQQ